MAFKLRYVCEFCSKEVWSLEEPTEPCKCELEEEQEQVFDIKMSKEESKARYKEQYRLNGYTWFNKDARMFMGAFNQYKAERNNEMLDTYSKAEAYRAKQRELGIKGDGISLTKEFKALIKVIHETMDDMNDDEEYNGIVARLRWYKPTGERLKG